MKLKESGVLKRELAADAGRHRSLAEIFAGFKSNVQPVMDQRFDIKGIRLSDDDEGALLVDFARQARALLFPLRAIDGCRCSATVTVAISD